MDHSGAAMLADGRPKSFAVSAFHTSLPTRVSLACTAESLGKFLSYAGILAFDVDVTGPQCAIDWDWDDDLRLQMALPIAVRRR